VRILRENSYTPSYALFSSIKGLRQGYMRDEGRIRGKNVNIQHLLRKPLTTMANLPGRLLGIKVKEGVYSREVGLP